MLMLLVIQSKELLFVIKKKNLEKKNISLDVVVFLIVVQDRQIINKRENKLS
jgi:hypothetical protein